MTAPAEFISANATKWRLRSLVAMGHSPVRISAAMDWRVETVRRVISGSQLFIRADFAQAVEYLWGEWWDKVPPQRTPAERSMRSLALRRAREGNWCCPAGMDEDLLDRDPAYQPLAGWRPATGCGIA